MLPLPLLALLAGCNLMGASGPENLAPSSELDRSCYAEYTPGDHARAELKLQAGQSAIDFTLKTPAGEEVSLSELLQKGKPVVLHHGSYTCDRYQERERGIGRFAKKFADDVQTVVIYTTEAHPVKDPSPYRGRVWKRGFSDRREAEDWEQRAKSAGDLDLPKEALILIDEMDNPVWCSYGTCPNCSFLIAPDGTIEAAHKWHDPKTMTRSTKALLQRLSEGSD